jgi:hypothetical protein
VVTSRLWGNNPKSGSSAALGQVQPLLPAISNCGAAHLSGENRRFRKRLSRMPIGDSPGRNCRT